MKYIKLFSTSAEYEAFIAGDQFVVPNISFIPTERLAKYSSMPKPKAGPKVTLNYDCPEDNLMAFSSGAENVKALTVDGVNIVFPPVVSGTFSIEINANKVNVDMESEIIEFPDNYPITSVPTSLIIKPKDDSVKITDVANGLLLFGSFSGMKMCEPMLFSDMDGMFVVDEANNQVVCTDTFLQEMVSIISMGYGYGFGLCNITNLDEYEYTIIDCLQIYEGKSGGLQTPYSFDTPGQHTVEMELFTGDFGCRYMFMNMMAEQSAALTSVVFNEYITSIAQYTFVSNNLLTEITCKSEIAPTIEYSFYGLPQFGKLFYPEGSDYSSWLENEGGLADYCWNQEQPIVTAKYNITDTSANTKLCDSINGFTDMIIDEQTVPLNTGYTFNTLGEHTVTFKLSSLTIDYGTFQNCSSLASIVIPDSVTSIGNSAFYGCSGLTGELVIPESVTSIGYHAFYNCSGLTDLTIGSGVTSIGSSAFYNCSGLTSIVIPDSVTSIGDSAFNGCKGLTEELVIPNSVTSIGNYAFQNCSELTGVTIGSGVTSISNNAFAGCTGLTEVTIGSGVTSIGDSAFNSCKGLTSIVIPYSVTTIGANAFAGCSGLGSITCLAPTAPSISSSTFYNVKAFGKLYYPEGSDYSSWMNTNSYYLGYYCWNQEQPIMTAKYNITDTSANTKLCNSTASFTDMIIDGQTVSLSTGYTFNTLGEHTVTFKLSSLTIHTLAFSQCSGLTEVTIGSGVTSIGASAFSGCSGLASINIPDSVTSIGYGIFSDCSGLTSIVIPDSVTTIGANAFAGCSGLGSITCLAPTAPSISSSTFYNVKAFGKLYYPEGSDYSSWMSTSQFYLGYYCWNQEQPIVTAKYNITDTSTNTKLCHYSTTAFTDMIIDGQTVPLSTGYTFNTLGEHTVTFKLSSLTIGSQAFDGCTNLTEVTIGSGVTSIGKYAFYKCSGLTGELVIPDSVTSIGFQAFYNCSGLTGKLVIPDSVTTIDGSAFSGCTNLTGVAIGSGVTSIGRDAFYKCSGLTGELIIPDSVTSIGNSAFSDCSGLTGKIVIPDSVTSIGSSAFQRCSGLTGVAIGSGVTSIGGHAFSSCSGLTGELVIPDSVTSSIGSYTFYDCSGLTSVTIGSGVTEIGERAFDSCKGLTSIVIPDSVTSIGSYAFDDCSGLTEVTIGSGVTSIGKSAFSGCKGLTSIVIPDSVTTIGESAFWACTGLTGVTIGSGVTGIGERAFYYCTGLTSINIPDSVTSIGYGIFSDCTGLETIVVSSGNTVYDSRENCNCIIETASNTLIQGCNTSFIPDGVTSIGKSALDGCSGLTSIVIPDSVTTIGSSAFSGCKGLTLITIPDSVTTIGDHAFSFCDGLTGVTIGSGVTGIGEYAFSSCEKLRSIVIPDSVTTIAGNTFHFCLLLTSVTIGSGVTEIGSYAFSTCTNLSSITCYAPTAPNISSSGAFPSIRSNGILYVPAGSDYSSWMKNEKAYLGYYNWTIQEITTPNE